MNEEKQYLFKRMKSDKISQVVGLSLVVLVQASAFLLLSFNGLSYIYPPPEESSFLLDFTENEEVRPEHGKQPVSEDADLEKPIEIVQKSESPIEAKMENQTQQSTPDNFGDVETPAPEPQIDKRALFPGMSKKNSKSDSPHTSDKSTTLFKEGQPDGNAKNNITNGRSNAHLTGRNVIGSLYEPNYNIQQEGVVVVKIWVDIYGKVHDAMAGAPGTTIDNKTLWKEARNAAMKTHFSKIDKITEETSEFQEGTITYIFKLK